jgi:hypothetical protein
MPFFGECTMNPDIGRRIIAVGVAVTAGLIVLFTILWLTGTIPDFTGSHPI